MGDKDNVADVSGPFRITLTLSLTLGCQTRSGTDAVSKYTIDPLTPKNTPRKDLCEARPEMTWLNNRCAGKYEAQIAACKAQTFTTWDSNTKMCIKDKSAILNYDKKMCREQGGSFIDGQCDHTIENNCADGFTWNGRQCVLISKKNQYFQSLRDLYRQARRLTHT